MATASVIHEEFDVAVQGGTLRVCRWPSDGPVVVAVHGITANALSFAPLAAELAGQVTLVAPDLRGRAGSAGLAGPYGLAAHTDDLVTILDHLGLERAPLVGHSMGGFVAALAAARHRDRVSSVLLVDGGVTFGVPTEGDIDAILEAVIGPALRRLRMTFETPESYLDFWRVHPALADHWSGEVEAYVLRDLHGEVSSCNLEAIRIDARDTLVHEETTTAFKRLTCPATLLWAQRGMLDEPQGLYAAARLDAAGVTFEHHRVDDTNHYTILLSGTGPSTIARHIAQMLPPP